MLQQREAAAGSAMKNEGTIELRFGGGQVFRKICKMLSRNVFVARAFVRSFAAKSKSKAAPAEKKAPVPRVVPPPAQPANPPPVL